MPGVPTAFIASTRTDHRELTPIRSARRRLTRLSSRLVLIPLVCCASSRASDATSDRRLDERLTIETLEALPKLPKIHYSWPVQNDWLEGGRDRVAIAYARITGAVCLRGETCTQGQVAGAVRLCTEASKKRNSAVSIGINYSVWHHRFDKSAPATDKGPSATEEMRVLSERFERIRDWLDEQRPADGDRRIEVTAILFDCERFDRTGERANDDAVLDKYNQAYEVAKRYFPNARVIWYGFGAAVPINYAEGYVIARDFGWETKNDGASVSLYYGGEATTHRMLLRETIAEAAKHDVRQVVPWVALGCGNRPTIVKNEREWDFDWDYDPAYSWWLGRDLNNSWQQKRLEKICPTTAVPCVVFYPGPNDPRVRAWWIHFMWYCRGAHRLTGAEAPTPSAK